MVSTAGGDLIAETSTSSSTGAITLSGEAPAANRRPFPDSFDGEIVGYLIQHESISTQFEVGEGVFTLSTRTLTRPSGEVTFGTEGPEANTDFSPGGLIVSNVPRWSDIAALKTRDDPGFDPTAIDLSGHSAPAFTQTEAVQLALDGGVTPTSGAACWIAWTGDESDITCDGTSVKWSDGTAGAKTLDGLGTLVVTQHPALGYAVAYLEGAAAAAGASQLSDLSDVGSATPTNRHALMGDGDSFESRALVEADISDLGTYLTSADVGTAAAADLGNGEGEVIAVAAGQTPDGSKFLRDDGALATPVTRPTRTVTANGNTNLATSDAWGTVEFDNATATADQRLVLPDISGFTRGQIFTALAQADDTADFPVFIAPAVSGQMRSQPQTPGHDPTLDEVQIGIESSVYARAQIEVGASKWIVTGHIRQPTPALAPDQFADLIQWHDALEATITGSTNASAWAARAGSGTYSQATGGLQPAIVGTPGEADYGLQFAGDDMNFGQTNSWTVDSWAVFWVFSVTADYTDNRDVLSTDSAGGTPRVRLYKLSGNLRLALSTGLADSSDINLGALTGGRHLVMATGNAGLLHVYTTGATERFSDTYTSPTWTASTTRRLSISSVAAGSATIHSVAEFSGVKNSDDWRALRKYAVSRGWIS